MVLDPHFVSAVPQGSAADYGRRRGMQDRGAAVQGMSQEASTGVHEKIFDDANENGAPGRDGKPDRSVGDVFADWFHDLFHGNPELAPRRGTTVNHVVEGTTIPDGTIATDPTHGGTR